MLWRQGEYVVALQHIAERQNKNIECVNENIVLILVQKRENWFGCEGYLNGSIKCGFNLEFKTS